MHDPIAYTYEADHHCPDCAEKRFGRSADGFIAEDAEDGEGNPVGALFSWDEWWNVGEEGCDSLNCGDCGDQLDTAHDDRCQNGGPCSLDGQRQADDTKRAELLARLGAGHGEFPSFAWPGGYAIAYVCDDGETLCADCVNDPTNPVHFVGDADGWRIDGFMSSDWHDIGEDEWSCEHCRRVIDPAVRL